ncbi:sulfurtransferase [Salibacterium aidingense]|uniref:sulfurtransferase n=1 Tax=Salibacterium aidingense TaxID=384933 RepID=UPI003BD3D9D2
MKYIAAPAWLDKRKKEDNVRIVDCRFQLDNPDAGRTGYQESHIPGAVYFDLEKDLSGTVNTHGGRHPLPNMEEFAEKLSKAGIDQNTEIIAYDDQSGAMAARFWWMLRYMGHDKTFVLDRSFSEWEKEGRPVESRKPEFSFKRFIPQLQPNMLAPLEEVKLALHDKDASLIDGRDAKRYDGEQDKVDHTAGRIPGAEHYYWKEVLDKKGRWKTTKALEEHFRELSKQEKIISYCGSGVTACVNILALKEAGFDQARLYAGSWSDWISYDDLPISRGQGD